MAELKGKISKQAWMVTDETLAVMNALGNARFVGGCVRDALVNRKTVDIDIATPLKPEEVVERLEQNKIKAIPTGIDHGTITAVVDGHPFEITTLREDVETDGRHAEVSFTDDWEKDAQRRDFTMNAMSADLDGTVYDYFGGMEDLRLGRVRFVGNAEERVQEDYLRILRFFRFFAFFGKGVVDGDAIAACKKHAEKISTLSKERITKELLKLLEADNVVSVWKQMLESGVVAQCLPGAVNVEALEKLVTLEHQYKNQSFALRRLLVLGGDASEALRLSNNQKTMLAKLSSLSRTDISTLQQVGELVYREGNDIARSTLLLTAPKNIEVLYKEATSFRPPRFPVQGKDVLALGVKEGAQVGELLSQLENWWIEQQFVPGRTECLEKLKALAN